MMFKVLVVGMSSILGGVEREVLSIIDGCSEEISFDFLCFGGNYDYAYNYPNSIFYYVTRRRKNYFKSQREQKEFWVENGYKYDVVWINTGSASNLSSHKFAKKYSNARIITHSHSSRIEHDSKLLQIAHTILHILNRRKLVSLSDKLMACSQKAANHLYGTYGCKATIFYNAIDVNALKYDENNRRKIREELSIDDNDILLICVGRIVKVKNFIYAVKVFKEIQSRHTDSQFKMLIIGNGSMMDTLKDYINSQQVNGIYLPGYIDNVKPFLDAADIFLQPSLFEGFPVSAIEAQANGLTCLISDRVTKEAKVTDLAKFISINNEDIKEWADIIVNCDIQYNRNKYNIELQNTEFDIHCAAKEMETILCNKGGPRSAE